MQLFSKTKDKAGQKVEDKKSVARLRNSQGLGNAAAGAAAAFALGESNAELQEKLRRAQYIVSNQSAEINELKRKLTLSESALNEYHFGPNYRPTSSVQSVEQPLQYDHQSQSNIGVVDDELLREAQGELHSVREEIEKQAASHAQRERGLRQELLSNQRAFETRLKEQDSSFALRFQNCELYITQQKEMHESITEELKTESTRIQAHLKNQIAQLETSLQNREAEVARWQSTAEQGNKKENAELQAALEEMTIKFEHEMCVKEKAVVSEIEVLRDSHRKEKNRMEDEYNGEILRMHQIHQVERKKMNETTDNLKNLLRSEQKNMERELDMLEKKHALEKQELMEEYHYTMCNYETEVTRRKTQMEEFVARLSDIGTQLEQKGVRIRELEAEQQTQTESIQQKTLRLNAMQNELNHEKRKAREAKTESTTSIQQLEFVQQQCAYFQTRDYIISELEMMDLAGNFKY